MAKTASALLLTLALLGGTPVQPAAGAFPGVNGKIGFASNRTGNYDVFAMNPDGSGQTNLTPNSAFDGDPAWSPDGTRIAFTTDRDGNREVYVMNADGSGPTNLTTNLADDSDPVWSPDGTRIAFTTARDGLGEVYAMNADGSGQTNITKYGAGGEGHPAWSPDGTRIAVMSGRDLNDEVYVMNADGSGQTNLTNNMAEDNSPDWQPLHFPKFVTLRAKPKKVEEGEKTRLKATVSPCAGHEGDLVEFYRKKKRIAKKKSNDHCVARLKVTMERTTKFHAVSPMQDFDHLAGESKPVKVKLQQAQ